jgi:hypothetical protein
MDGLRISGSMHQKTCLTGLRRKLPPGLVRLRIYALWSTTAHSEREGTCKDGAGVCSCPGAQQLTWARQVFARASAEAQLDLSRGMLLVTRCIHSLSARGKLTAQLVSSVCSLMSSRCISRMASMLSRHTNFSPSALFLFPFLC